MFFVAGLEYTSRNVYKLINLMVALKFILDKEIDHFKHTGLIILNTLAVIRIAIV